jgi:NTP pyrophosphatase (non-canonical NTP hydrolase)
MHHPAASVAEIIAELQLEAHDLGEWCRKWQGPSVPRLSAEAGKLADAVLLIFDHTHHRGLDIGAAIAERLEKFNTEHSIKAPD